MAITYVGVSSTQSTAATFNLSQPAATAIGDLLVVAIEVESGTSNLTTPSPNVWTTLTSVDQGGNQGVRVYWRFADTAGSGVTYTFGAGGKKTSAGMIVLQGTDTTNPLQVFSGATGTTGDMLAPSLTNGRANSVLLAFYGSKVSAGHTQPTGMTQRYVTTATDFRSSGNTQDIAATGETGTRSGGTTTDSWTAISVLVYEPAAASAGRVYYNASSTGTQTNNTTTYVTKTNAEVTFTPTIGKRYAIFWSAMLSHSAATSFARARLQKTTGTAVTFQLFNIEPEATTDLMAVNDVSVWTADVSTSTTFAIQFSASAGTTTISDAYITVLELFDDEQVSTNEADQSTAVNTYTNLNTITVPAGDWFIIGALAMNTPATNQPVDAIGVRIFDETSAIELTARSQYFSADANAFTPYFAASAVSPTVETTYALQFLENSNATLTVRYRTLVALNRANFAETFAAEDQTTSTTTSATYTTKLALSETLGFAENYLVLMGWTTETASTTVDVFSTVTKNGTDLYSATTRQPRRDANDVDDQYEQGWTEIEAQTATLTTWDIDYRAETAGTTVRIEDAFIFVMNLDTAPAVPFSYSFGFILF